MFSNRNILNFIRSARFRAQFAAVPKLLLIAFLMLASCVDVFAQRKKTTTRRPARTERRRPVTTRSDKAKASQAVRARRTDKTQPTATAPPPPPPPPPAPNSDAGTAEAAEDETIVELREQSKQAISDAELARIQHLLIKRLVELNRKSDAVAVLRKMALIERYDPVFFYNTGNALARLGDSESAIETYRKAITQQRNFYPRAHNNLGVVLMRLGRWDEAEESFKTAIEQENTVYPEASYNLGRLYALRGETGLATRELQRTLKRQPEHTDAAIVLARLYAEEGDTERGFEVLNTAAARNKDANARRSIEEARRVITETNVEIVNASESNSRSEARSSTASSPAAPRNIANNDSTNNTSASLGRASAPRTFALDEQVFDLWQNARAARENGRYEEAAKLYRRVIAEQGGFYAPANLELSYALISLKRNDEAIATLEALTTKVPARYPIAYYHLGRLYESRKDFDRAAENYSRAASAFGDKNPQILLDLSRIREKQGDMQGALAAMEAYVQANERLGNTVDWAARRLAELRQKAAAANVTSTPSSAPKQ